MDALVIHAPRDLRIEAVETPQMLSTQMCVQVRAGGICGSDLHYYQNGGFGTIRIQQPMILGHEVSGIITRLGSDVSGFAVGQRVAVSPSRPCGLCRFCQQGLQNHCLDMHYYGSAMRMPHVQGAFRQELIVDPAQAQVLADSVSDAEGSAAEPLSVALHAVRRAGPLMGQRVLITGCGPIGALMVVAARRAGATHITVTDVATAPLATAAKVGADEVINMADNPQGLDRYSADKGFFDVLLEASGNERALIGAFSAVRPRGVIVQVGLGGSMNLPVNTIVSKEFDLRGAFRFHEEYAMAVAMLNQGLVDVRPLISHTIPFREADRAFALAADRSQAMKVVLDFA